MTDVMDSEAVPETTRADWQSDQEVRWCPGCGDYSILTALQLLLPDLGVRREKTVFISILNIPRKRIIAEIAKKIITVPG